MKSRPNVLLIITDQHARDVAGYAGDSAAHTEHLDALAARSVQFDTAVCASPVCTSSRMCMLTGKEAHRCAAWNNHWILFPEHVTWPQHFADHGYRTCLVGKMHFGGKNQMNGFLVRPYGDLRHGLGHQPEPIDMFPGYSHARSAAPTEIPESLLQDVVVTRETLGFVREHLDKDPDTPWFVCTGYGRPHSPLTAPGRYIRRARGKVPPVGLPADWLDRLDPYARHLVERAGYARLSEEERLRGREGYYAALDFVDDCIGELLEGLERDGLLENTIVIYTTDHGEMGSQHGMWGKGVYYEPSIGVPVLMTGPGIRAGHHRVAHPMSLMDLFPTTCALAGLPVPDGLDGVDFSSVLSDPSTDTAPRRFAPSAFYLYGVRINYKGSAEGEPATAFRCIRQRDWKYVEVEGSNPLLFDMINDPEETRDLANDPAQADRCAEMRRFLFEGFSWEEVHTALARDRARLPEFCSGLQPSTPNQYMLPDGRVFDAEKSLYDARWLQIPPEASDGGIIPQMFG